MLWLLTGFILNEFHANTAWWIAYVLTIILSIAVEMAKK